MPVTLMVTNSKKKFNDYFKCKQFMWYCIQGALHCLIPREEDFLTWKFN